MSTDPNALKRQRELSPSEGNPSPSKAWKAISKEDVKPLSIKIPPTVQPPHVGTSVGEQDKLTNGRKEVEMNGDHKDLSSDETDRNTVAAGDVFTSVIGYVML